MGIYQSKQAKLRMMALGAAIPFTKVELVDIRDELGRICGAGKNFSLTISRKVFHRVLRQVLGSDRDDIDVLDQLFTLWDHDGSNAVPCQEFLVGLSPLACDKYDSISIILKFALFISNMTNNNTPSNTVGVYNVAMVLQSINTTASFFGDKVLSQQQIDEIVRCIFLEDYHNHAMTITHDSVVPRLVMHPLVTRFVLGKGGYRYRPVKTQKARLMPHQPSMLSTERRKMTPNNSSYSHDSYSVGSLSTHDQSSSFSSTDDDSTVFSNNNNPFLCSSGPIRHQTWRG